MDQIQNLLSEADKQNLIARLGLTNATEDQKQQAVNEVVQNIYTRIAGALVEEDVKTLEKLNEGGINNEAIKYFLLSRIPNLGKIVAEELTSP
ncbi:MAG: hypothetical protein ACD_38C00198G0003 [uncultured bacterium]|uniref:Uncharacterized protein n=1 Tax=Candidatus Daviesbacteria bacterium GW2011_GWC2_40_12 TaxID=1618431 RepID=A0A0G0TTQ9_9BACT|nr:MAG: hypothetical protein ACD_38C00198G0003 [uncultured bacterium]KKQ82566.1 MAG: hypothetical protein UT04_C0057G0014 [Candidatus Daviesbacteria bacterium GW2011_GWF2_38_7]KKR15580.1 MAG: hypothetical protein UT45_C0018G0020 [Candidatus Daviesbacteria bacterium GW2011_GWA2_39_33]KKR22950.1 MAG: hypothetical protein UT54_C0059G0015 [Candidatus Daviesbacteria bacterium GW2011_GWB1_39_5]KKR41272.1 MAG: hypothetical protein UT77_C0015G0014 [Candidatus Daviesbacteria bacterium GW2011_GWC2_40_12]